MLMMVVKNKTKQPMLVRVKRQKEVSGIKAVPAAAGS
jgi:hypothetical protein